jgi:hypothetical protein
MKVPISNKMQKEKILIMAISARTEILTYKEIFCKTIGETNIVNREERILNDLIKTKRNELGYL